MGPRTDVFITVQPSDYESVIACVESVRRSLGDQVSRVCIVTAALPNHVRQTLADLGCEFLHEADVFGIDQGGLAGEIFSQWIKWELRRFATTGAYLVIDADAVLSRPIQLRAQGGSILFCRNRYRFGYAMCFNYFFGQIPQAASPADGKIVHFERAVVDEMIHKIEAKWKAPWPQATSAILQQVRGTAFDAAQIYADYLRIFRPNSCFSISLELGSDRRNSGVVRMGTLGHNGRFANQIFQYAYLRTYARQNGLQAECPPWIGCSLFGHQTTLSENELPIYREDKGEVDEMIRFDPGQGLGDIELWGYFQEPGHWAADRQQFRGLFEPLPFLKKPLDDAIARLRSPGQTLVAIHLRRGDFSGGSTFWPAPEAWYLRWLESIWPTLDKPILYIASDDLQNVLPQFAVYRPKTMGDLNVTVNGAEFYGDFYVLSQCDVLGISNSTFSYAAAMMNTTASLFVRPDPVSEKLVGLDPWTSPVQLKKPEFVSQQMAA